LFRVKFRVIDTFSCPELNLARPAGGGMRLRDQHNMLGRPNICDSTKNIKQQLYRL
jgi:hypothetical protein